MTALAIASAALVLSNSFGRAEIDLRGARLRSYVPAGGREVFLPVMEADGSGWSSGGVPVCWPWFYDRGPAGSGLHGFARLEDFRVVHRTADSAELALEKAPLALRMRFTLGRRLSITMTTENSGGAPASVTEGLHAYFAVADVARATLEGLDGVRCTTKRRGDVAEPDVCGPRVALSGANDICDVKGGVFFIDDPAGGRRLRLEMSGMGQLTIWNGRSCPKGSVCVEPIVFREPLTLAPGVKHELGMTVEVLRR